MKIRNRNKSKKYVKIENLEQETYFNITFDKSSYRRSALLFVQTGRGFFKVNLICFLIQKRRTILSILRFVPETNLHKTLSY